MPTVINPVITDAGLAAAINASGNGTQLAITHVVLGAGQYSPTNTSNILDRREKVPIAGGFVSDLGAFRVNVLFPSWTGTPYNATEIGFYAGDPDAGGVLFAVFSHPTAVIVNRNTLDYVAQYGLRLARVPTGSITVTIDPMASQALALISAHEAATDPHGQYVRKTGSTSTGLQRLDGGATAGAAAPVTPGALIHIHSGSQTSALMVETDPGVDTNIWLKRGATLVAHLRGIAEGLQLAGEQIIAFRTAGAERGRLDQTGKLVLGSPTPEGRLRIVAPTTENAHTILEGANPDREVAHILRRNGASVGWWGIAGAAGHLAPAAAAGDVVVRVNGGGTLRLVGNAGVAGIDVASDGVARIKQAIPANDNSDRAATTAWLQAMLASIAPTESITIGQLGDGSLSPVRPSVSGYIRLSSGHIIQFGGGFVAASAGVTGTLISFPLAFVERCYQVVATDYGGGIPVLGVTTETDNKTSFRAWAKDGTNGSYQNSFFRWIAIGR